MIKSVQARAPKREVQRQNEGSTFTVEWDSFTQEVFNYLTIPHEVLSDQRLVHQR